MLNSLVMFFLKTITVAAFSIIVLGSSDIQLDVNRLGPVITSFVVVLFIYGKSKMIM